MPPGAPRKSNCPFHEAAPRQEPVPTRVTFLEENGFETVHWSAAGAPTASDAVIMAWARDRGFVVITHDLDFSAILASTEALGPSVISRSIARGPSVHYPATVIV